MFNKLFTKILDSSIWLEPNTTRIVWITLLAAMDEDGYCHFSTIQNLADRARVTKADTEKAVRCFLEPDEGSGNPANEGRRIEKVPGGYIILNAGYYRDMMNRDIQREQTRIRVQRWREKQKALGRSRSVPLPGETCAIKAAQNGATEEQQQAIQDESLSKLRIEE